MKWLLVMVLLTADGAAVPQQCEAPQRYDDDKPLLEAVRRGQLAVAHASSKEAFENAWRLAADACEEMGSRGDAIDPAVSVGGVPLLTYLGGFVQGRQTGRHSGAPLSALVLCLLRAGVDANTYGPLHNQWPILLVAAQHRNRAIFEAVIAHPKTDHNVVFRHLPGDPPWGGNKTKSTFMHALAGASPTTDIQLCFSDMEALGHLCSEIEKQVKQVGENHAQAVKRAMDDMMKQKRGGRPEFRQWHMQELLNAESTFFVWLALKKAPNLQWTAYADGLGQTPLHKFAAHGNAVAAKLLLEKFPQLAGVRDVAGKTAFELAIDNERAAVVKVLRSYKGEGSDYETPGRVFGGSARAPELTHQFTGGWSDAVQEDQVIDHCDIDELTTITPDDFFSKYVLPGRPLVLRGFARDWRLRKAWAKDALLAKYGKMGFTTGPVPYSKLFGEPEERTNLQTYVQVMHPCATRATRTHAHATAHHTHATNEHHRACPRHAVHGAGRDHQVEQRQSLLPF